MRLSEAQNLKVGQIINVAKALEENAKRGHGQLYRRRNHTMRRITSVGTEVKRTCSGVEYIWIGTDDGHPIIPQSMEVWPSTRL